MVAVVAAGSYHQRPQVYKEEKPYMSSPPAPYYPAPHYKENKPAYQSEYKSADYEKKGYDVRNDLFIVVFLKITHYSITFRSHLPTLSLGP